MRKITEKEYKKWLARFEEDSHIIYSLLNVIDNSIQDSSYAHTSVENSAIACNARLLKERHDIDWVGFYNWKELFEEDLW